MAITSPGVMSAFQVGSKGTGKRVKVFLLKRFTFYSEEKNLSSKTCTYIALSRTVS